MTNILTKIIKANQEYEILGGGSSSAGEEHEVVTQAAYDQLTPAQKAEKVYMIKESGTPSTVLTAGAGIDISNNEISADMATAVYDNTTSGATATNVQDAIDEVFQSVSNGKELLADAITDKGVQTSASDSFSTMATNISNINGLDSSITQSGLGLGSSDLARCEGIWGNYTNSLSYCNAEVDGVLYSIGTIGEYDYTSHDWTADPAIYVATVIDGDTIKQFKGTGTVPRSDTNRGHGYYSNGTTYYQDGNKIYLSFGTTVAYNTSGYDTLVSLGYFDTTTKEFTQNITTLYRVPYGTEHPDNEKTSTLTKYRIGYTVQEKAFNGTGSAAKNAAVIYPRIYKVS